MNKILKTIIFIFFYTNNISANTCSSYYNPDRFFHSPIYLENLIKENIEIYDIELFDKKIKYEKLYFIRKKNLFIKNNSYLQQKDYIYPIKSGLWKYSIRNGKINEINISRSEIYRYSQEEIANDLNDSFEEFWTDWNEDAYEMQLIPNRTLFKYKNKYFAFSVFIYGVIGDSTKLKGTKINYLFKDFTKEVNIYKNCILNKKK